MLLPRYCVGKQHVALQRDSLQQDSSLEEAKKRQFFREGPTVWSCRIAEFELGKAIGCGGSDSARWMQVRGAVSVASKRRCSERDVDAVKRLHVSLTSLIWT